MLKQLLVIFVLITMSVLGQAKYWEKVSTFTYQIIVADSSGLFYGGNNGSGSIFKSLDKGKSWNEISGSTIADLKSFEFFNGTFWVIHNNKAWLSYSPDCTNWQKLNTPIVVKWFKLTKAGLYIAGDPTQLLFTSDNGTTWETVYSGAGELKNVLMADSSRMLILNNSYEAYKTFNGGNDWYSYTDSLPTKIITLSAINSEGMIVLMEDLDFGISAVFSKDFGKTWNRDYREHLAPDALKVINDVFHFGNRYLYYLDSTMDNFVSEGDFANRRVLYTYFSEKDTLYYSGSDGLFRTYPGYDFEMPHNFVPLAVGNAWQFDRIYLHGGNLQNFVIKRLTSSQMINGKEYFDIGLGKPARYDKENNILFLYSGDRDIIWIDFDDAPGTEYNVGNSLDLSIVKSFRQNVFGRTRMIKGILVPMWANNGYEIETYFAEGIGLISSIERTVGVSPDIHSNVISAKIDDGTGEFVTYLAGDVTCNIVSEKYNFETSSIELIVNLEHPLSDIKGLGSRNYVESATLEYFVSRNEIPTDTIVINLDISSYFVNYPISISVSERTLTAGDKFYYRVKAVDKAIDHRLYIFPEDDWYEINSTILDADEDIEELSYSLIQNYPNPFNPSTCIAYSIKESGNVRLTVYNTLGQLVTTLVNEYKNSGEHTVDFNAANLTSGVYFYKIESGSFVETRKMILLR